MSLPSAQTGRPFAPESGRLRVDGTRFRDADGRVWRWRGATEFLLFARYLNGEDITPQLDWLVAHGFNVLRVFGEVPGIFGADRVGITNYERPFERPDFDRRLDAFFGLLERRGLRCEYTVLTYPDAIDTQRAHVQRVYDVAASHWNVFVEVANEPENNRIDPIAVMKGVDRRGVLSAYGLDPGRHDKAAWKTDAPVLDYGTAHDLQREPEQSARNTRATLDMQIAYGVPFVNDEPIGAIDPGHPGFKRTGPETFGGVNGGGARAVSPGVFIPAAAIAYMTSAGYTFHFQRGLEGRVPLPGESIQQGIAAALRDVALFIPRDAPLGAFVEPAIGGLGYGVTLGNQQWVVVPRPGPQWTATAPDGWRIDAVGPVPYLLRLVKPPGAAGSPAR